MKKELLLFALIYNSLNFLFIWHMQALQEEGNFIYKIILPVFWFISFILYYEICANQISWLKKNFVKGLLLTCLCVPIVPILLLEIFI